MIKLGENIRRLRLKNELTQEQLADILDVSPQAVSRWETGAAYPDITILPAAANYFGVTTDELLGVDISGQQEEIQRIKAYNDELRNKGKVSESVSYLREKIREFPHSAELVYLLAHALEMKYFATADKELLNEVIALCNKAMRLDGGKSSIVPCCTVILCRSYKNLGMDEKAYEMAVNMPSVWGSRELMLAHVLDGKKEFEHRQYSLLTFLDITIHNLHHIARFLDKPEHRIEVLRKAVMLADILTGEDHKFYNEDVYVCYLWIARNYCELGDTAQAFENLKLALKHAEMFEERPKKSRYDAFWLPDVVDNRSKTSKNYEESLYGQLLRKIAEEPFALLHGTAGYAEFCRKVSDLSACSVNK